MARGVYRARLAELPGIELQVQQPWARSVFWMYGLVCREETGLDATEFARRAGRRRGVETRPFFLGMHEQPVLRDRGLFAGESYPVAERIARQGLYLPSGLGAATMSRSNSVCQAVREALRREHVGLRRRVCGRVRRAVCRTRTTQAECDLIAARVRALTRLDRFGGCSTWAAARAITPLPLAERGYQVVGVDRSDGDAPHARSRASTSARFERGRHRRVLELGETFDAVLMMFAVLGYQIGNAGRAGGAAHGARRHLAPGGLFLCDVWYGPAVLAATAV